MGVGCSLLLTNLLSSTYYYSLSKSFWYSSYSICFFSCSLRRENSGFVSIKPAYFFCGFSSTIL